MNPTLMAWLPDPRQPSPNGDPHEPLPQPLPGEPPDPKRMQFPRAAANVGARPATATRSSGSGGSAPRGDDAAALGSPVEAEADCTARVVHPSASALPDDLDQVWQPLLWDRPNRRWHPVTTVNTKENVL